jgi:hypothetical protein
MPKFNGVFIDKPFRNFFGLLHAAVAKQVYLANDVAVISQHVHFVRWHLQPPSAPGDAGRMPFRYRPGPSRDWIKVKNPKSPAMNRAKNAMLDWFSSRLKTC